MAVIAGCARSPYDVAQRDTAAISADIRQAIGEHIARANRQAAARDGKVYVDVKQFKRMVAFVPVPARRPAVEDEVEEPASAIDDILGGDDPQPVRRRLNIPRSARAIPVEDSIVAVNRVPPPNAVLKRWTDRFALAQELSYRYAFGKIRKVARQYSGPPYFTAEVEVLIKATQRWAYGGKAKSIPKPPAGYVLWRRPDRSFWGTGIGGGGSLPIPETPVGKVVTASQPVDPVVQSALDSLRQGPPKDSECVIVVRMAYDHQKNRWQVVRVTAGKNFPTPRWLSWEHGVEQTTVFRTVFRPEEIGRKQPKGTPVPEK